MRFELTNGDHIQVEHVERVTQPSKSPSVELWSFSVHFVSGENVFINGDQNEVELAHRRLITAMADRP